MLAAPKRTNDNGESEEHVFEWNGLRLLKSKAIYGANASGKSNVVRAIRVVSGMVRDSVKQENMAQDVWNIRHLFNSNLLAEDKPIYFQYIGSSKKSIFRYGFQIKNAKIESEWLFWQKTPSEIEEEIFSREEDFSFNKKYLPEAEAWEDLLKEKEHEIFRSDSLFLTGSALMGAKKAIEIRAVMGTGAVLFGLNEDDHLLSGVINVLEKGKSEEKKFLQDFIRSSDTGIESLELVNLGEVITEEQLPDELKSHVESMKGMNELASVHRLHDEEGNFVQEIRLPFIDLASAGTKRLLGTSIVVYRALKQGTSIIIDEFDSRLHPNLTAKILELFHNPKTNPNNAQLIFVTHDTGLLRRSGLRRDQIAIIDKDQYGASHLTTLIVYKGVRKDASLEKEYLRGAYRGIPNLNKLDDVVEDLFAE